MPDHRPTAPLNFDYNQSASGYDHSHPCHPEWPWQRRLPWQPGKHRGRQPAHQHQNDTLTLPLTPPCQPSYRQLLEFWPQQSYRLSSYYRPDYKLSEPYYFDYSPASKHPPYGKRSAQLLQPPLTLPSRLSGKFAYRQPELCHRDHIWQSPVRGSPHWPHLGWLGPLQPSPSDFGPSDKPARKRTEPSHFD